MTAPGERESQSCEGIGAALRRLVVADGWPTLAVALVTVALEMGVYFGAWAAGASRLHAATAALACGAVWVALAAPAMAAAADSWLGSLVRGGVTADASALSLIVIWLTAPQVGLLAAVEVYCLYAALAVAGVGAVWWIRGPTARFAAAAVASSLFLAALASPFWIGGIVAAAGHWGPAVAAAGVYANPFYGIWSALAARMPHAWHQAPVLYDITYLGTHVPVPAAPWYAAAVLYTALGLVLSLVGGLFGRAAARRRRPSLATTRPA